MRKTWLVIFLVSVGCSTRGQNIDRAKLDSFLNALDARGLAMGSLAISQNGNIVYQKAMGYAHIDGNSRQVANLQTRYRIGSATKMFTAVMIFQLVEEGRLKLEDKLATFYPDLPNAQKITIRHMLYHQSGLHDYTHDTDFPNWMDKSYSHDQMLRIVKGKGPDFEPGTDEDYCNSNYLILGYIIEKICKTSYANALKARIISRLKLTSTYYGKPIDIRDQESTSYKYSEGHWAGVKETNLVIHGGAGAIVSTPSDMVVFMDALFSHKLVSKTSLDAMKTMVEGYGMGMFPDKYGDKPSFGHNGRIEEFYSALWHFPSEKLSIAYCTNGIDYPRSDIMENVLKICFQEPVSIPFEIVNASQPTGLDKYLGKYASEKIEVNCTKDGSKMYLETRGKAFDVAKVTDDYFMNAASGYFFEFHPEQGELLIKETDNIYRLKKVN